MALATLKGIDKIGGFEVLNTEKLKKDFPDKVTETGQMEPKWFNKEIRPNKFIHVNDQTNSISFTIQNGPIKENGVNGCQVDTIIETASIMVEGLNKKFSCEENGRALARLHLAIQALNDRKEILKKENNHFDFGYALNVLRKNGAVARWGWNGKNQFVALQLPDSDSKMERPYLYLKCVDGQRVPWVPSQSDVLCNDWTEVDRVEKN